MDSLAWFCGRTSFWVRPVQLSPIGEVAELVETQGLFKPLNGNYPENHFLEEHTVDAAIVEAPRQRQAAEAGYVKDWATGSMTSRLSSPTTAAARS